MLVIETVDVRVDVELRVTCSHLWAEDLMLDHDLHHRSRRRRRRRPPACPRWSGAGLVMWAMTLATRFRLSTEPRREPAGPPTRRPAPLQHSGCYSQSES